MILIDNYYLIGAETCDINDSAYMECFTHESFRDFEKANAFYHTEIKDIERYAAVYTANGCKLLGFSLYHIIEYRCRHTKCYNSERIIMSYTPWEE